MGAAVALAGAGAHVVLSARSGRDLRDIVEQIGLQGGSAEVAELDVTERSAVDALINSQPAFDILVNNAGMNRPGPMQSMSEEDFDGVMGINVKAAYFVAQSVVGKMLERQKQEPDAGGSIIYTSSQMGHVGGVDRSVYCASKFAVEGIGEGHGDRTWAAQNPRKFYLPDIHLDTPDSVDAG